MKKLFLISLFFICVTTFGQTKIIIVPQPVSLEMHLGVFKFNTATNIISDNHSIHEAKMLNVYLKKIYGFTLPQKNKLSNNQSGTSIVFKLLITPGKKGAYNIDVDSSKIVISSPGNEGLFYGMQTLLQLLPETKRETMSTGVLIPQLSIKDYPRFQYRGMHLDVSRNFFDVDFIKKYIDYLAYFKYNTFHWHLTDDQGWRIEIKKYPRLTSVGGFRNGTIIGYRSNARNDSIHYGGFYTQEQIKDIVKYAQARFITIIPEIEMPGHASAAIAAYPQLSCFPNEATQISDKTPWNGSRNGKLVQQSWGVFDDVFYPSEYTFKFLENVLDEVMKLFPSKYIHIGADECRKTKWKRSAFCQKLIKDKNLKDEHGLQSYFIQRIEKYVNSKGRNIIGWDEILEGGLAPNATVMSWRGTEGGIAAAGQRHNVIMTPGSHCYFNNFQTQDEVDVFGGSYLPLDTVYNYEPIPRELNDSVAHYILGAQGNVWSEHMKNPKEVEYMVFPRMSALSEVLWSPKDSRNWTEFSSKLTFMYKRYELWGANYYKE